MHNLKEQKGTFKGVIGECMFKMTSRHAFLTRVHPKWKFFTATNKYLTDEQKQFIDKNWYSLDSIEIQFIDNKPEVLLYEVKTQNKLHNRPSWWKPKITQTTAVLYEQAIKIGFCVKLAIVEFQENWNFEVKILDYASDHYSVDRLKKYDKIRNAAARDEN